MKENNKSKMPELFFIRQGSRLVYKKKYYHLLLILRAVSQIKNNCLLNKIELQKEKERVTGI